jgi:hypothetical protein
MTTGVTKDNITTFPIQIPEKATATYTGILKDESNDSFVSAAQFSSFVADLYDEETDFFIRTGVNVLTHADFSIHPTNGTLTFHLTTTDTIIKGKRRPAIHVLQLVWTYSSVSGKVKTGRRLVKFQITNFPKIV